MHGTHVWEQIAPFMNHPRVRASEIAAGNASATARGLAKVYSTLSLSGDASQSLFSKRSTERFGTEVASGEAFGMPKFHAPDGSSVPMRFSFALGYQPNVSAPGGSPPFGPSPTAFGHTGAGGQIAFCDPANRVGVGFVRNQLSLTTAFSETLILALYACL
jgi:CubicO group peptidase (beta-lactamase class C family)